MVTLNYYYNTMLILKLACCQSARMAPLAAGAAPLFLGPHKPTPPPVLSWICMCVYIYIYAHVIVNTL